MVTEKGELDVRQMLRHYYDTHNFCILISLESLDLQDRQRLCLLSSILVIIYLCEDIEVFKHLRWCSRSRPGAVRALDLRRRVLQACASCDCCIVKHWHSAREIQTMGFVSKLVSQNVCWLDVCMNEPWLPCFVSLSRAQYRNISSAIPVLNSATSH